MMTEWEQRDLLFTYYTHMFKDPKLPALLQIIPVSKLKISVLTLAEWIHSALKRKNLNQRIIDRLQNALP